MLSSRSFQVVHVETFFNLLCYGYIMLLFGTGNRIRSFKALTVDLGYCFEM
ncbi:hypothetical protein HanPI659440_Chr04g0172501 [Helianthus annuus]|nr:hypothetical protein HanPI659440_Chr04g0172501 [Helianthus annuus]